MQHYRFQNIMVLLSFLLSGCRSASLSPQSDTSPSVLVITLDTTRADRLSPYGGPVSTPIYDKLAQEGSLFTRAYTPCPLTIPAHSTLMTGMSPIKHGVRDNGEFILGDEHITLAERFQDAGYFTAAFTSAFPTQSHWGFGQGFDLYHDPLGSSAASRDWRNERRADEVIDDMLDLLDNKTTPSFVWLHLFDAHWPYEPPEPFATNYEDKYNGEIAYTAHQVNRAIEWWNKQHPNSVVVITADHGEGMGDGGELTHGFLLHDGTIRIPLIVWGTGVPKGQVFDVPVGLLDIAPTVLDLADLGVHDTIEGQNLFTKSASANVPIYSESLVAQRKLGLHSLHAHSDKDGRYVKGGYSSFYPYENGEVSTTPKASALLEQMIPQLEAYVELAEEIDSSTAPMDAETLEQLAALGYMGGVVEGTLVDIDPRDVIDIIPLTWHIRMLLSQRQIQKAEEMFAILKDRLKGSSGLLEIDASIRLSKGLVFEAIELYSEIYELSKNSTIALQIADAYSQIGDWEAAYQWYKEAHDLYPTHARTMYGLVHALVQLNELDLAWEYTENFLVVHPDLDELALLRAEFLLAEHRLAEALEESTRALERSPLFPSTIALQARVLWEMGEADEAISLLQEALRLYPFEGSYRLLLTTWLIEQHRFAEAVRLIRPMKRLNPYNDLAWDLYEQSRSGLEQQLGRALPDTF